MAAVIYRDIDIVCADAAEDRPRRHLEIIGSIILISME